MPPLFSFCILAYNNYQSVFETLDSLLSQDYPEIELIVSNDGSKDFDEQNVRHYIRENSRENVRSVLVRNHTVNHGTVRNAEWCRTHARGEYLMYMAADDALDNSGVLSAFAAGFECRPEAMILCARTEMCGALLEDVKFSVPSEEVVALLKSGDNRRLYSRLSHDCLIPTTSTCYRASVYAKTGGYDGNYRLIEDYSFFARAARMGIRFCWEDGLTASRHRDGGVSHGNVSGSAGILQDYRRDEMLIFEREFLPYTTLLLPEDRKRFEQKLRFSRGRYLSFYEYKSLPFERKLQKLPTFLFYRIRERLKGPYYFLQKLLFSGGQQSVR